MENNAVDGEPCCRWRTML